MAETIEWKQGEIIGCTERSLKFFEDERGWLAEVFRNDEIASENIPVMGYLSMTRPGQSRGPHEHVEQSDLFAFFDGAFRLYLWDDRRESESFGHRKTLLVGKENALTIIVPPGVVHAYKNVGSTDAIIINCPNQLYGGEGKSSAVDEIRHEDAEDSRFRLD